MPSINLKIDGGPEAPSHLNLRVAALLSIFNIAKGVQVEMTGII